jgi:GntR family transcriptional regulator, carbon starvation induced regulator
MQSLLFDQASRYREIMVGKIPRREDFFETHEALVRTILSGEVEHACEALRQHLRLTLHDVYGDEQDNAGRKDRVRDVPASS